MSMDWALPMWWDTAQPGPRKQLPNVLDPEQTEPEIAAAWAEVEPLVVEAFSHDSALWPTTRNYTVAAPGTTGGLLLVSSDVEFAYCQVVPDFAREPGGEVLPYTRNELAILMRLNFDTSWPTPTCSVTLSLDDPTEGWRLIARVAVAVTYKVFRAVIEDDWDDSKPWTIENMDGEAPPD